MIVENENDLISVIKEDCRFWENLSNKGNLLEDYLYLNECHNSKSSGMYQLVLNGCVLWYGTLQEINAIVKSMITICDKNYFRE